MPTIDSSNHVLIVSKSKSVHEDLPKNTHTHKIENVINEHLN